MDAPSSKTKAADIELVMVGLDTIQRVQEDHGLILAHLEARPVVELAGVERRLDELADRVTELRPRPPRQRVWWLTPMLLTLAVLVGYGLALMALRGVAMRDVPALTQSAPVAPAKKGK
jgi:hypothetical protein